MHYRTYRDPWPVPCARTTGPARSCSSTTPARRSASSTGHRRDPPRRALRRRAGRSQLHLRRGHLDASSCPTGSAPTCAPSSSSAACPRSSSPTTSRAASPAPAATSRSCNPTYQELAAPLRRRRHPGAAAQAPGQGQSRGRRADGRALDPGAPAPPAVLHRSTSSTHAIGELLDELNDRPFQKLPRLAAAQLVRDARPAGPKPLPRRRATSTPSGRQARVNIDYHVEVDGHYYSVPHALVQQRARCAPHRRPRSRCFTRANGWRSHARSRKRGAHTTVADHMPEVPPQTPGMDARAVVELGAHDRTGHPRPGALAAHPTSPTRRWATAPASDCSTWRVATVRAPGSRLPARAGHRFADPQERRVHPRTQPRSATAADTRTGRRTARRTPTCADLRTTNHQPHGGHRRMLNHTTLNTLRQLRLPGMAAGPGGTAHAAAGPGARLRGALRPAGRPRVTHRENMRLGRLLKEARLKQRGLHRGHRLPRPTRTREKPDGEPCQRRLDPRRTRIC